jgi:citronellyl-CoA dehydrogenase
MWDLDLGDHELFNTDEHRLFRQTVRRFVQDRLVPRAREFDQLGRIDKALYPEMGEVGMLGIRYDPAYGGLGLDWSYSAIMAEELACCDNAGVALGVIDHTDMATPSLATFGSDDLRRQYLVAAIRTRAVRHGDDWVINGSKMYITNISHADFMCLLAVTDPDAGYGGFSQIVVPTSAKGVSFTLLDKIGNWGSDTGAVYLEDVCVPVTNTIGEVGRGFQQQMAQFQDERLIALLSANAGSLHLWKQTVAYARERSVFGKPVTKFQFNQFRLVDLMMRIYAARELGYQCVRKRSRGEDATLEISMGNIFCIEVSQQVATVCMQLHGGAGYMKENVAGRAFVDSRLASIGGGADEVMMQVIARMLGL